MKTYKTISGMVEAMKSDEIPADVVSPGAAAAMLGVTRQAINDRLHNGKSLEAWSAEGTILISVRSIKMALKKRQHIFNKQGD
ncbi:MAG: hypothetical protein HYU79_02770 [Nitrosomonadales bacterium]|nr:hypothetical protein [Nitrosomonadales bacterium]